MRYEYSKEFEEDYIDKATWMDNELKKRIKTDIDYGNETIDYIEDHRRQGALAYLIWLSSSMFVIWNYLGIMVLGMTYTWIVYRNHTRQTK